MDYLFFNLSCACRLEWLGHILRMDWGRLVHKTVRCMYESRSVEDILMDASECGSWEGLIDRVKDMEY